MTCVVALNLTVPQVLARKRASNLWQTTVARPRRAPLTPENTAPRHQNTTTTTTHTASTHTQPHLNSHTQNVVSPPPHRPAHPRLRIPRLLRQRPLATRPHDGHRPSRHGSRRSDRLWRPIARAVCACDVIWQGREAEDFVVQDCEFCGGRAEGVSIECAEGVSLYSCEEDGGGGTELRGKMTRLED
jgi:hypothetical protein